MNIDITRGLDQILFGMSEKDLVTRLGAPDKIIVTDVGNRDLCYYELRTVFKVEPANDNRVGWISVQNQNATLSSLNPWQMKQPELLAHISKLLGESFEMEDYGEMESFSFPESQVELQYELGHLTAFNYGVPYDQDGEPRWPSLSHQR